ncbi:hypothetical protein [Neolewinella litorea]|uniref:Uncharacterized protein n=1 Tax=Neolewinella litorea TaxID=2562452 RepID=A0A4S4NPR5_9BACT|nr:hypothetical protein [Neolewinella litorea]THH42049.1 hypothetical protein E4021_05565 [Neolewinella litorea]
MPRTRLTVFSRFIIFLLIALPIVYVAAALFNGEDPVANVKGWLGMDEPEPREESYQAPPNGNGATDASLQEIEQLRSENERLRQELTRCRSEKSS